LGTNNPRTAKIDERFAGHLKNTCQRATSFEDSGEKQKKGDWTPMFARNPKKGKAIIYAELKPSRRER